ncbi:hypothetical protein Maes01_00992 [Microbulbifer aestuariivivens]|uniref:Peptidase M1 membrane alanine aminopeptidase domain-containing protein n=1 Tax=Microbulbifer aestuariivivens TaxID=1908308 RepID=A0ABP9WMJ2_9GAMM
MSGLRLLGRLCGIAAAFSLFGSGTSAQTMANADPFARLTQAELGLGAFRSASGAPAANYWQQRVDYDIDVELLPARGRLQASALLRYHNRSPDALDTLYFALDHDALKPGSRAGYRLLAGNQRATTPGVNHPTKASRIALARSETATGFSVESVTTATGRPLQWRVKNTLLQVRLPQPLQSGDKVSLAMTWSLPLTDKQATVARSGYETLADGQRIYIAAQWFPRAVAYTDYAGWQLKPFLQQGEFSTELGRYRVRISAPQHFVIAASGDLQNAAEVLEREQFEAWQSQAREPRWIVDASQAQRNRKRNSTATRQWIFSGQPLRDFAFAASPAFHWQVKRDGAGRRLQLFFPQEAASLWSTFGLEAIDHTLQVFDQATFRLPLKTVSVVNAAGIGMEYPGLATIATRPQNAQPESPQSETPLDLMRQPPWDALSKYDFIGSIIHEVGHNYLPMAINTDEREWAWLDEGLVSFIEYRAEHGWEASFEVIYGEPRSIAGYTASAAHQPIMTSADSLQRKIDNAYNKTASVLNMLRHLVLSADDFDHALRRFAANWQGKRPMPGDFFRAMESAAGEDLSWFWRSWFFQASSVDFAITAVEHRGTTLPLQPVTQPEPPALAYTAGAIREFLVEQQPALLDAHSKPLPDTTLSAETAAPLPAPSANSHWYQFSIGNAGSGILPLPLRIHTASGAGYRVNIPAQTWMRATARHTKWHRELQLQLPLPEGEALHSICIDPLWLTPDTDRSNNCIEINPA